MAKIKFTKMHGCGNDYIYVDTTHTAPPRDPSATARSWSDRHMGIGSDGLVLIGRADGSEADLTMRIFNADGSEAMMCGNASRCIARYAYERGLTTKTVIRLLTRSGIKVLHLHLAPDGRSVESVTVDMGEPRLADERLFRPSLADGLPAGHFVSMGNPHYVVFTDDVDSVAAVGHALERHPAFPERVNIELARLEPDGRLRTRVWERGSGITMACGTGACATAVAAAQVGIAPRRVGIDMDGGTLDIEWRESDGHVLMTGPATFVCDGVAEEA